MLVSVVEPGGEDGVIVVWANALGYGFSSILASKRIDPETEWPTTPDSFGPVWSMVQLDEPALTYSAHLAAVPDGAGGAIAAWMDNRTGSYRHYTQRVDTNGNLMWGPGDVAVTGDLANASAENLAIAADGEGGAVITWNEQFNDPHTLRAQRLDADGNTQWAAGGVVVDTDERETSPYTLALVRATDGNFIVLYHLKGYTDSDWTLVTQKLAAADGADDYDVPRIATEATVTCTYSVANIDEHKGSGATGRVSNRFYNNYVFAVGFHLRSPLESLFKEQVG